MRFTPRQRQIAGRITAGLMTRTIPEFTIVNRVAFAVALARHTRRLWQQEMEHEEIRNHRDGVGGAGGVGLDRDERHGKVPVPMIRVLLALLPEWLRLDLWHALRERYSVRASHKVSTPDVAYDGDEVVVAPTA